MATGRTVRQVKQGERLRRIQGSLNQISGPGRCLGPDDEYDDDNSRFLVYICLEFKKKSKNEKKNRKYDFTVTLNKKLLLF